MTPVLLIFFNNKFIDRTTKICTNREERAMKLPFEGLLGDTCETRLLQFMLPMYGIGFDMAELVDEIGMTRQSIAKALKKFAKRGMVKIQKEGRTPLYSINEKSPLVRRLEDFDNSLIESMLPAEEFAKIRTGGKEPVRKTAVHYTHPPAKVSGVASPQARYVKKRPVTAR
jgi:DNA-binding transcriptional ArsR family regulator